MAQLSRREFSKTVAATGLAAAPAGAAGTMPRRQLGQIDFEAGILGLGAQHLGDYNSTQATADRVVAEAIDNGLNYIDTAPTYRISEERLGHALKGRRDQVFLVSKVETTARGDVLYQIRDSLRKLQTDHLDCVHIHNFGRDDRHPDINMTLSDRGTLGGLIRAKKEGLIRHIGVTSHLRPARTMKAFETGEVELFMCNLNFVERHIYNFEEKVLPEAKKRNIAVIAMKVLGGPVGPDPGARLMAPNDYEATLRYVWGLDGVAVAIVGMRNPGELRQGLAAARSYKPFEERELAGLLKRGKKMAVEWGELRGPAV